MPSPRPTSTTTSILLPGRPVRGSRTGRPVMALLDLLGRRGALRVLWELRDGHSQSFRLLQDSAGGMSPSVLNDRLKELRDGEVVELRTDGYALTVAGAELLKRLRPLHQWAENHAARLSLATDAPAAAARRAVKRTDATSASGKK
jgi:DNA-binding HxlR family transcriptional regulator